MQVFKAARQSIWSRLIVGLVTVAVLAALATSYLIYTRFVAINSAFRDRTLQGDAMIMRKLLKRASEGKPLQFPDFLADNFQQGRGKYAIVSDKGVLISGSPGVNEPLAAIDDDKERDFFLSDNDHDGRMLYGYTLRGTYGTRPVWIQVAVPDGELAADTVLAEFVEDIGWVWVPVLFGLLGINLMVARIGLAPLREAASQAEAIGPNAVSGRLDASGLPREVEALVNAINRAFDRLEDGLEAQKAFIADAAHELRTPVAVLKAHSSLLTPGPEVEKLKEEIRAMERLVNQLLDSARIGAMNVEAGARVDLTDVAINVAHHLGPICLQRGRSIEVDSPGPVLINGSAELLRCAVRNLAENAMRFTPRNTSIEITVAQDANDAVISVRDHGPGVKLQERADIFKRFWQGGRDRGGGAGLGMDIVARIVKVHSGSIELKDAPGGGALFEMRFAKAPEEIVKGAMSSLPGTSERNTLAAIATR
ncbi:MAG: HAMP domain-containing sensor histidine kinase [Hyphomicrobiaceae bacterium]